MADNLPVPNGGHRPGGQDSQSSHDQHTDGHAAAEEGARGGNHRRRPKPFIMSEEQVLAALTALPNMSRVGLLSKEDANITHATLKTLLGYYQNRRRDGSGNTRGLPRESLQEILRRDPKLLNVIAPILDDATYDELARMLEQEGK